MGGKTIRVTNLFTGKTNSYGDIEAFRKKFRSERTDDVAGIIDMLADAYRDGRSIGTYEWMLGITIDTDD